MHAGRLCLLSVQTGLALQLYINGEFVDGSSGETFDVLDPRTEVTGSACCAEASSTCMRH